MLVRYREPGVLTGLSPVKWRGIKEGEERDSDGQGKALKTGVRSVTCPITRSSRVDRNVYVELTGRGK